MNIRSHAIFPLLLAMMVSFAASTSGFAGDTVLSDPKPDMDNPRKIMLTLTTNDPAEVNSILYNVINIQKFYGMDNVQLAVIAYGKGVRALMKESSPVPDRISSLRQYDVEFIACENTLTAIDKTAKHLLEGVSVVTAGIPEIVERRLRGWNYIHP
ncbi:MAG: DsrE family protein [Rhodospirillales bacterium]|nr:DsrE family protein [Rhodospirillales bacterium]MCW8863115.1 DsrE family protein [Rhodospirillales bacterium]MCW8951208.1 DsrE family protein [Rhodospirillales bacterium]MCW8971531.1 DsrE family protein [Rhodospirillales bacterium]MCW9001736.1 DsrE family protein [Rhodospirillales bacterium]